MRDTNNSTKGMKLFTAEYNTENQIIVDYKEMEGIDTISEDELLRLLGDTYLYDNLYYLGPFYFSGEAYLNLSDYEQYQIDRGYDPIACVFLDELNRIDYQFVPIVDTVQLCDSENEDLSRYSFTPEGLICSACVDEGLLFWLGLPKVNTQYYIWQYWDDLEMKN